MGLYKKAGARYFVSMGSHHDNFYLWNSKLHKWNAVNMGPKRDVVGDWQKAATKLGLRFGVSEHLGASFTWFQSSHRADKTGPKAGVPYDGADAKYQDLYHFPAESGDTGWYSTNPRWQKQWFERIKELVDNYHPDLLYTDGGVPFGNDVGLSLIAHLYNTDAARHGGTPQVVYTCKQDSHGMWVQDLERGVMAGIRPEPWQTDTSIGDWFYNKNWRYRGADWVIHMLADIVAKNGNLLLNVVQRPDGTLDPEAEQVLHEMADWMAVNGEAIYGTRPWLIHGEGPVRAKGGHFGEDFAYSAKDIRFTSKGDTTLYAIALGWPRDGSLSVHSLAKGPGVTAKITGVSLLGLKGAVQWSQVDDGLQVHLPATAPSKYAVVLKITGTDLRGFKPAPAELASPTVFCDPVGNFTLQPEQAGLHGDQVKTETRDGVANIGFWDNGTEWVSWKLNVQQPGTYRVLALTSALGNDAVIALEAAGQKITGRPPRTGSWARYAEFQVGTLDIKKTGDVVVSLRARDPKTWKPINLRWVKLVR
jgi:alpha-L-fucosidase